MARKTVTVASVIERINTYNRESKGPHGQQRRFGQNVLASDLLHAAGAYAGFTYLAADNVPDGEAAGIVTDADGKHTFPDESRVWFYTHKLPR